MSYWDDKTFVRIYRRIQKFSQRHPEQKINVLEQARQQYYQTQNSVKLVSGKEYTPQQITAINRTISKEPKPPAPPIDEEDPIIKVAGTLMRQSKWKELMLEQRNVGTAKTLSPDTKLYLYLKSLFRGDKV